MARVVIALFLAGCLGPVLPLQKYPHLAHEWLCVNRACPAVAQSNGGVVIGARYVPSVRRCECLVEDSRHLPIYASPDPHER